jgi:hypothetical protein
MMIPHPRQRKLISIAVALLVVGSVVWFTSHKGSEIGDVPRGQRTVEGRGVCLPHRDTSGPITLECAFGLSTDVQTYYALDLSSLPLTFSFETGTRYRLNGYVVPIEEISSDQWKKYNIRGIIHVDTIEEY